MKPGLTLFRAFLGGLAFLAFIVALNRLDTREAPAAYSERDLPPSSLESGNGAFWLLFLGEPETAGLAIERKIPEYRRLLGELKRVERLSWQASPRTRPLGARYWRIISDISFPSPPEWDWPDFLRAERGRLERLRTGLAVLLGRYERMIRCETVSDFGFRVEWDRSYALLSFVQATARLHAAISVIDAESGLWSPAAGELISVIRFGERLTAAAQSVFFLNLGRSLIEAALHALAGLMNLPGCPREAMESLLAALPALSGSRLSARTALVGEFLWASERIENGDRWRQSELALREILPGRGADQTRTAIDILVGREIGPVNYRRLREAVFELFLMKNRTRGYFRDSLEWLLALDASPPFRWGTSEGNPPSFRGLKLWWLWNPSGKLLYESLGPAWHKRTVERMHLTRTLYDLTRISAELHLRGDGQDTAGKDRGVPWPSNSRDPFSGRPYGWNADRGLLWSVGVDGKDDLGNSETDLVLPIRLR